MLSNDKIKLRALEPEDLELLYQWENDSKLWQVSNTVAPFSKFVLKQYLDTSHQDIYTAKQLRLVIVDLKSNEAVGLIDLFDFDFFHKRVGLGILVNESASGNGFAQDSINLIKEYVFNHLGLKQIFANITVDNAKSLSLFEKLNFEKTGCKKSWIRSNENYLDEFIYQFVVR